MTTCIVEVILRAKEIQASNRIEVPPVQSVLGVRETSLMYQHSTYPEPGVVVAFLCAEGADRQYELLALEVAQQVERITDVVGNPIPEYLGFAASRYWFFQRGR